MKRTLLMLLLPVVALALADLVLLRWVAPDPVDGALALDVLAQVLVSWVGFCGVLVFLWAASNGVSLPFRTLLARRIAFAIALVLSAFLVDAVLNSTFFTRHWILGALRLMFAGVVLLLAVAFVAKPGWFALPRRWHWVLVALVTLLLATTTLCFGMSLLPPTPKYLREPIAAIAVYGVVVIWFLSALAATLTGRRRILAIAGTGAAVFAGSVIASSQLSEKSHYVVVTSLEGVRAARNWNRGLVRFAGMDEVPPLRDFVGARRTPLVEVHPEASDLVCLEVGQPKIRSVFVVTIDALRSDYFGVTVAELPNFARLRSRAVEYAHAVSPGSGTSEGLFALRTGRYPVEQTPTRDMLPVLARDLGMAEGYNRFQAPGESGAEYTDWVIGELDRWRAQGKAFVFHPHYLDIHLPLSWTRIDHDYGDALRAVDQEIGRLLDYLEQNEMLDEILFVVTGDHGEELRGERGYQAHGYGINQSIVEVPLFMAYPGAKPRREERVVSTTDVLPTALELLATHCNYSVHGVSLLQVPAPGRTVFASSAAPNPSTGNADMLLYSDLHAAIDYPWKIIFNRAENAVALYHLGDDPHELDNLADTKQGRLDHMLSRLDAYLRGCTPDHPAFASPADQTGGTLLIPTRAIDRGVGCPRLILPGHL